MKTITANRDTLQEMIEALDTLQIRYTIKNTYLSINNVKKIFAEFNREYDGASIGLNETMNGLFTGHMLSDNTIIPVWTVTLHRK